MDKLKDDRIINDAGDVMRKLITWNHRYPAGVIWSTDAMLRMVDEMNEIVKEAREILKRIEVRSED